MNKLPRSNAVEIVLKDEGVTISYRDGMVAIHPHDTTTIVEIPAGSFIVVNNAIAQLENERRNELAREERATQ